MIDPRQDGEVAQGGCDGASELAELLRGAHGDPIVIANEFSDVQLRRVDTRNGSRLLISSPKSGQWITLDALEIEALTWQNTRTLAAMVGNMHAPLLPEEGNGQ